MASMPSKKTPRVIGIKKTRGEVGVSAGKSSMLGIHQNIKEKKKKVRSRLLLVVVGLVEEEIGGELFVLIAGEVCLDNGVPGEA